MAKNLIIEGLKDAVRHARGQKSRAKIYKVYVDHPQPMTANAFRVDTMPTELGDRIILTIDPETDVESLYSIQPAHARELGQALIHEADQASK